MAKSVALTVVNGRWDASLGSLIGLLTIASWALGDSTPLTTLDSALSGLGVPTAWLGDVDAWMSERATPIGVLVLLILAIALVTQARRIAVHDLNVSIASEHRDEEPEMWADYMRYFGATEVRFWAVAWICAGVLAQLGWISADRRLLIGLGVILTVRVLADTLDARSMELRRHGHWPSSERFAAVGPSLAFSAGYAALVLAAIPLRLYGLLTEPHFTPAAKRAEAEQA
jgi:hypothetical protein